MKNLGLIRYALMTGLAAALAGCTGSTAQTVGGSGTIPHDATTTRPAVQSPKRGVINDDNSDLLYVATYENTFFIVNYKSGKVSQEALPGESFGGGACSSGSDVFIAGYEDAPSPGGQIFEYQHGGTVPSNILADGSTWAPNACSVEPTTGSLAVSNNTDAGGGHPQAENISVYPGGVGPPTIYSDPMFEHYDDVTYDSSGNLFIIGNGPSPNYQFELAELAKGSSSFTSISLPSQVSGNHVQWDGQNMWSTALRVAGMGKTRLRRV